MVSGVQTCSSPRMPIGHLAAHVEGVAQDLHVSEGGLVTAHGLLGRSRRGRSLHRRVGAGEIVVDEGLRQAHRVEYLGAAIGLVGGDAHLGEHLEHRLAHRLDVALVKLFLGNFLGHLVAEAGDRVEGQIRIDRLGAVAGEKTEVVGQAGLSRLHHRAPPRCEGPPGSGDGECRRSPAGRGSPPGRQRCPGRKGSGCCNRARTTSSASRKIGASAVSMPAAPASAG